MAVMNDYRVNLPAKNVPIEDSVEWCVEKLVQFGLVDQVHQDHVDHQVPVNKLKLVVVVLSMVYI
jgi:hypothetical protein